MKKILKIIIFLLRNLLRVDEYINNIMYESFLVSFGWKDLLQCFSLFEGLISRFNVRGGYRNQPKVQGTCLAYAFSK